MYKENLFREFITSPQKKGPSFLEKRVELLGE